MFSATFYILGCTAKNRVLRRLQRLREPRYLVGAIVGVAYIAFAIFGRAMGMRTRSRRREWREPAALLPAFGATGPALGGLGFLLVTSFSWLLPLSTAPLAFTAAETAVLFPAPLTRRQLLLYRIIRSQWSSLIGAAIFAIAYPIASAPARLRGLFAGWLLLMTVHVFLTGIMLTRLQLRMPPGAAPRRGLLRLPFGLTVAMFAVLAGEIALAARAQPMQTASDVFEIVRAVSQSGLTRIVLAPFVAVVSPLFATSFPSFLAALGPAFLVYGVGLAWVLASDEAVEMLAETSGAERPTAVPQPSYSSRPAAWPLALHGRPEGVFIWKAAQQTFRLVDRRGMFQIVAAAACWTLVLILVGQSRGAGIARVVAWFTGGAAVFAAILGPQMFRRDMRQDLAKLDVLQTWPVRPAAVVRGEILWPAAVVTVVAWLLGTVSLAISASMASSANVSARLAIGSGALVLVPALVLAQYTIHNAAALIFPAWIPADGSRPRGVDAFGQRVILFGGTFLVLVVSVLPAAIVGGLIWLVFYRLAGVWILVPVSAIAAVIVLIEVVLATEALGPAYESLDMTSVERTE